MRSDELRDAPRSYHELLPAVRGSTTKFKMTVALKSLITLTSVWSNEGLLYELEALPVKWGIEI